MLRLLWRCTSRTVCASQAREEALALVADNGFNLSKLAEELQSDREIVLAAVSQNGDALMQAPEDENQENGQFKKAGRNNPSSAYVRKKTQMALCS
eukprot:5764599-Amphidinium_carterae.1